MKTTVSRRSFFQTFALAASGAVLRPSPGLAVEPLKRAGRPRLLLSLAAYSFRDFFKDSNRGKTASGPAERSLDLFQFVDFCADHGCDGTELTSYYFPRDVADDYLIRLRRHAFLRGIAVSGTAVGNTFTVPSGPKRDSEITMVKKWIDHAALLSAPHIRIFAGAAPKEVTKDEATRLCLAAIEECADYAGQKGIFLGIENHGGIVSEPQDLLAIVRAVKSPWVGINLDTGNFHTEDPYGDLEQCAPYAVNVQIKAELSRRGQKAEPMDLARIVKMLRDVNYQGYVALEYESKEDPWKAVPEWLERMKAAFAA
jgi:sugar phosphate isomerase/epimerase